MLHAITSDTCADILEWKKENYEIAEMYYTNTGDSIEQLVDNIRSLISTWPIR